MDRRRFIPRPDGLESRQLLSTARSAPAAAVATPVATDPNTAPLRQLRIDRLPNYQLQIRSGRGLPIGIVSALQDDLRAIESTLTAPPSAALRAFNLQLRKTLGQASLSVANAKALNDVFEKVLLRSNANPALAGRFADHMDQLTRENGQGPKSAATAAGDYGLVMQLALGIGIKLKTPAVPAGPRAVRG